MLEAQVLMGHNIGTYKKKEQVLVVSVLCIYIIVYSKYGSIIITPPLIKHRKQKQFQ